MNSYRTHTCDELRPAHVDQVVTLVGWVDTVRDHGGVIFIDLRDRAGKTQVVLLPDPEKLSVSCVTSFKDCPFDPQFFQYELEQESYAREIAPGRTFVDYKDLRMLLSVGLCKGGSLDAAAIIHDGAIICKDELRFENEIVRHKIMDAIGDIYLAGCRITGKLIAVCPGHPKNVELAGKLLAMRENKQA